MSVVVSTLIGSTLLCLVLITLDYKILPMVLKIFTRDWMGEIGAAGQGIQDLNSSFPIFPPMPHALFPTLLTSGFSVLVSL
ncbi:hypothetical protein BS47DRAFT_1346068 [Hydnum rufescens UP504]|uniref:Uncharacterized protein n=1 Tax=Hydnum rufescens UP504 TaxID=1448309 RepID=A0A9P6AU16_9AGAM|nr:hypothetical protein BS47DRAFT_1346068 [Hydnum rufescens UP504]